MSASRDLDGMRANATATAATPDDRRLTLLVIEPGRPPRIVQLVEGGSLDLGRDVEASVQLEDSTVSRLHARITAGATLSIEDLGSKNGTRVAGVPVPSGERRTFELGDLVEIGAVLILVQMNTVHLRESRNSGRLPSAVSPMARIQRLVERIATDDLPVILIGETGVGKEVLAERIHRSSKRRTGPFVCLHAAAITPTLFEAELFGHEKGAYTGAEKRRAGLIEQAEGGTLFVDEVAELPPVAQVKLLRVLENHRVRPIGGDRERHVDVRIVAATNRHLEREIAQGRFRQDLYFRLNGFTIRIPPLRDRRSEIPGLCSELLAEIATERGVRVPSVTVTALAALADYPWPGNIRELRNVLRHALLLSDGERIQEGDLPLIEMKERLLHLRSAEIHHSADHPPRSTEPEFSPEKLAILDALGRVAGNQKKAAEILGVSRRTLVYWLGKHGIPRPRK